jgi:hypothetical protein
VQGSRGTVSAAFAKSGRVALVAATGAHRGMTLGRHYRHRLTFGHVIVRTGPHGNRIFGLRGGKVRYVAVTGSGTLARRKLLRRYLRAAGIRLR